MTQGLLDLFLHTFFFLILVLFEANSKNGKVENCVIVWVST